MSVTKRADGKAVANVRDRNGVHWIRVLEDIDAAYAFHAEKTQGRPPKGHRQTLKKSDKAKITVGQFLDSFIAESKARLQNKQAKWKTIKLYIELRNCLPPKLANTVLQRLTRDDCRDFLNHLQTCPMRTSKGRERPGTTLKRATAKNRFALFVGILEKACDDLHRIRADNPGRGLKLPSYTRDRADEELREIEFDDTLRLNELTLVLKIAANMLVFTPMYFIMICIMAFAGLRPGEVIALKLKDLDLDGLDTRGNPVIHVRRAYCDGVLGMPKTWKTRDIDVDRDHFLFSLLKRWKSSCGSDPSGWAFPRPTKLRTNTEKFKRIAVDYDPQYGICVDYDQFQDAWEKIMRLAQPLIGRHLPLYSLRHAFATNLFNENAPLEYISRAMGHMSIATTAKVYTKWGRAHDGGARRRVIDAVAPPAWPVEPSELAHAHQDLQILTSRALPSTVTEPLLHDLVSPHPIGKPHPTALTTEIVDI